MKIYAMTDYDGCDYITAGKLYEVVEDKDGWGFEWLSDTGSCNYSGWSRSYHLDGSNWQRIEVGTLAELDVKAGDVVECVDNLNTSFVEGDRYTCVVGKAGHNGTEVGPPNPRTGLIPTPECKIKFRIISRAPDANPKTWREMTDAEKGALLLAKHEGKVIDRYTPVIDHTGRTTNFEWVSYQGSIHHAYAYRIRPEPKRESVTFKVQVYDSGIVHMAGISNTHRITFTTTDGEPDLDSIKMERV